MQLTHTFCGSLSFGVGTTVENALLRMVAGVTEARASFADSYATVTARLGHRFPSQLEQEALNAVDAAGFDAQLLTGPELERWTHHTVHLHVEGMMCQKNCGECFLSLQRKINMDSP